uniref:Uncharacterized protein n=1 Tax=Schizaphis graminum TaxID=13262 RepID=A0A2S2NEK1_SCHGA
MSHACQNSIVGKPFDVNRIIVKVIANNIDCEGVSPLDVSMQSNICPLETFTVQENMNSSYLIAATAASSAAVNDTPKRTFLKQNIHSLPNKLVVKNKKLKVLQQSLRRKEKKITLCICYSRYRA